MKKLFSILVLLAIVAGVINLPGMHYSVYAANTKTITVSFKSNPSPSSVSVTKAPFKYNKSFAFSLTVDDGYIQGYDPVFRYLNGGYVTELGQTVNGLYSSDGTGYRVPFKGGFNWISVNSSFSDIHIDTPGYMTWNNLREAYALGWEPINHGWSSMVTPNPSSTIINYPAPHGASTIDYSYEIAQNTAKLQAELGATIQHFGLPAGDTNYLQPAWNNGMKTVYAGQTNSSNINDGLMNAANDLDLNNLTIQRKYFADQTVLQDMKDYIDNIADTSTGGANFWGVASAHRVRTQPTEEPDNGNLSFSNFKGFMDYVSSTYGIEGNDTLWMASSPEIYEYLANKQKTVVSTNLAGSVLTITLDHSLVDSDLRRYALSLMVSADAEIESISYGAGFTHHSENTSNGLINLDWGFVSLANDLTRGEEVTSAAETNRTSAAVDAARTFVNLLESGSTKDAYTARINNIILKPRTWQVSFGHNATTAGSWNIYGGDSVMPSPILTMKDVDGNISSATVSLQQAFSSKSLTGGQTATPANSGYFPDTYLQGMIRMYSASTNTTPGIVRLGGLDQTKKYEIVLLGGDRQILSPTDKTVTVYNIQGVSQELQTSLNTNNTVIYNNLSPDSNGNIDISVAKKYANWGWGILNALEVKETTENVSQYSITFDANGGVGGIGPILMDYASALSSPTVTRVGYSFTGWSPAVPETVEAGNAVYTAQWAASTVNITFDANGGTGGTGPTVMQPGDTMTAPAVVRAGYVLAGWSPSVSATVPSSDATYTAQWIKTEVGITKTQVDMKVNIKGWTADTEYQIWTYQKVMSDLFLDETENIYSNQWILSQSYTLGSEGAVQPDGSILFTIDSFVSPNTNYTVAVRTIDENGSFVSEIRDSYTPEEVLEAQITKVLVDGEYARGSSQEEATDNNLGMAVKQIKPGAFTTIKVVGNLPGMTYTATVKETMAALPVSSGNEFIWDISALAPRSYSVRVTASNGESTVTKDIKFVLYSSDEQINYGVMNGLVISGGTLQTLPQNIEISPNFGNGNFYYVIREPGRKPIYTSNQFSAAETIEHEITQFGTYHVFGYVNRASIIPGEATYDDGIIKTLEIKRSQVLPSTMNLSVKVNSLPADPANPIAKGAAILFEAGAEIGGIGETPVQYSFWRYDAKGYSLVKDWSSENYLNWTPGKVGEYSIEARAKGEDAGSYEVKKSINVSVTNTGEAIAQDVIISLNEAELNQNAKARVPITIKAFASSSDLDNDLLYKFYVTDNDMGTMTLQNYSANQECIWIPRKAGAYQIKVLVKNQVSYGKYDAIGSFEILVD